MTMKRLTNLLGKGLPLLVLTFTGCTMRLQTPALHTMAADFNIYSKPALFYDTKDHFPSLRKHTNYYLWSHGPVVPPRSAVYRHPVPEVDRIPLPGEGPAPMMPVPPSGSDGIRDPSAVPVTPGMPMPPVPPPPVPHLYDESEEAPPPRQGQLLAPPALEAPTVQIRQQVIQQTAGQSKSPAVSVSHTLFARP